MENQLYKVLYKVFEILEGLTISKTIPRELLLTRRLEFPALFKRSISVVSGLDIGFDVFHGWFENGLTELAVPGAAAQADAVATFDDAEGGLHS